MERRGFVEIVEVPDVELVIDAPIVLGDVLMLAGKVVIGGGVAETQTSTETLTRKVVRCWSVSDLDEVDHWAQLLGKEDMRLMSGLPAGTSAVVRGGMARTCDVWTTYARSQATALVENARQLHDRERYRREGAESVAVALARELAKPPERMPQMEAGPRKR